MLIFYTIEYYDEEAKSMRTESGVTGCDALGDGVNKVVTYYGDMYSSIKVVPLEDVVSLEELEEVKHG
jgi:hypothetical protein